MYYAGYKAKKANSSKLLKIDGYHTSSDAVREIIAKEGLVAFRIRILKEFSSSAEAYEYECKFLRKVKAASNKRFFNRHCNESAISKSSKFTDKRKAKISAAKKGVKLTEAHKRQLSVAHLGKKMSDIAKQKLAAFRKGKTHSAETKAKMRASMLGRKVTDEARRRMSEAKKKFYAS
jgi:hypothetical protein